MSLGLSYQVGDLVAYHFVPGIIVASYFVSLAGSITTVELLHKRTNGSGWVNWLELAGCSFSMGLVAIWCMHYVGNRAIVMGNGDPDLQLIYNAGYTALSVFVPVISLLCAFLIAGLRYKGRKSLPISLIVSGILSGLAVVGMHYIGNLGIKNYSVVFSPAHIGGAVAIACFSCVGVLSLFSMLQDLWLNRFIYRLCCAGVIALAVTSMHFEASVATKYRLKFAGRGHAGDRNTNVIVATVLSFLTIPACLAIGYISHLRRRALVDRAQQVVLAAVWFDSDGRLLVNSEGHIPSQKITIQHNQMAFDDEFNISHPAFQWIFRVSHQWASVSDWIPVLRRHLQSLHFIEQSESHQSGNTGSTPTREANSDDGDYSIIFRESFCVAAEDLAGKLRQDCKDVGCLYPGIMMSGTVSQGPRMTVQESVKNLLSTTRTSFSKLLAKSTCMTINDFEASAGLESFGKGQVLFLTKEVYRKDCHKVQAYGYRFAPIDKVIPTISSQLQVHPKYFEKTLNDLRDSALEDKSCTMMGTHLGLFALRAGVNRRAWRVLVDKSHPDRLPCVELSRLSLSAGRLKLLEQLNGLSATGCLAWLEKKESSAVDEDTGFWHLFQSCIYELASLVQEPFFRNAIFSSTPIMLRKNDQKDLIPVNCNLLAFHIIPDVHSSSLKKESSEVIYTPLSFFRCRQQVRPNGSDQGIFSADVHREFATLHATKAGPRGLAKPLADRKLALSAVNMIANGGRSWVNSASTKMKPMVQRKTSIISDSDLGSTPEKMAMNSSHGSTPPAATPFGGILVSSDVTVETETEAETHNAVDADENGLPLNSIIGNSGATRGQAYTLPTNAHTFVDELFELAVARWRKHA